MVSDNSHKIMKFIQDFGKMINEMEKEPKQIKIN